MMKQRNLIQLLRQVFLGLVLLSLATVGLYAQKLDFSGQWKQDNDRCKPKRNGDVTLRIEHRELALTVETTMSRGSQSPRHALQKYSLDGKVTVSTGADGDEFHTAVEWKDGGLHFSIEEHEDGRILLSTETWTLIENGTTLQRVRERPNGDKQVLVYRRLQPVQN